jgi:hypothetical protein
MKMITVQGRHCAHQIDMDQYSGIKFDTKELSDDNPSIARMPASISNAHCETRRPKPGEARQFFSNLIINTP